MVCRGVRPLLLAAPMEDVAALGARVLRYSSSIVLWTEIALVSRDTPPVFASCRHASPTNHSYRMRRQLLFVAIGARQRILSAEILDVAQPVAEHALRQAAPRCVPMPQKIMPSSSFE